jgi:hypothetical protein
MSINSHLSTCVGTQSPKYLEMAQGHISLSKPYIGIDLLKTSLYFYQFKKKSNAKSVSKVLVLAKTTTPKTYFLSAPSC